MATCPAAFVVSRALPSPAAGSPPTAAPGRHCASAIDLWRCRLRRRKQGRAPDEVEGQSRRHRRARRARGCYPASAIRRRRPWDAMPPRSGASRCRPARPLIRRKTGVVYVFAARSRVQRPLQTSMRSRAPALHQVQAGSGRNASSACYFQLPVLRCPGQYSAAQIRSRGFWLAPT